MGLLSDFMQMWDETTEYFRAITPWEYEFGDYSRPRIVLVTQDLTLDEARQPYTAKELLTAYNRVGSDLERIELYEITRYLGDPIFPTPRQARECSRPQEITELRNVYSSIRDMLDRWSRVGAYPQAISLATAEEPQESERAEALRKIGEQVQASREEEEAPEDEPRSKGRPQEKRLDIQLAEGEGLPLTEGRLQKLTALYKVLEFASSPSINLIKPKAKNTPVLIWNIGSTNYTKGQIAYFIRRVSKEILMQEAVSWKGWGQLIQGMDKDPTIDISPNAQEEIDKIFAKLTRVIEGK